MPTSGGRVVSLLPSATEIVAALGCIDRLIGRSHECDFPADVLDRPICSRPRIDVDAASGAINREIVASLASAVSIFEIDTEQLARLAPTLILTQDQCEACAVSLAEVREAVSELAGGPVEIVSLSPSCLDDAWDNVHDVAAVLGVTDRGRGVVAELRARLNALSEITGAIAESERPTVGCIEWLDPLMAAGNWVPELVAAAGGINSLGTPGAHSPWINFDELLRIDPEVVVVMPCGFDIERTRAELPVLTGQEGWSSLRAVKTGRVALVDGHQYFNRPGPRLVDSAEILAEILSPSLFDFGHEGPGWQRL